MLKSEIKSEIKKHSALYGIFLGIVVVAFALLTALTFASRSSWKNGLASQIQKSLNRYESETYTVNKFIEIKSPLSTSAAVYSLIKKGASQNESCYGVIIRIPSLTGPAPAVFVCDLKSSGEKYVHFAGFAEDFGKAAALADARLLSSGIGYWESVIFKVLDKIEQPAITGGTR